MGDASVGHAVWWILERILIFIADRTSFSSLGAGVGVLYLFVLHCIIVFLAETSLAGSFWFFSW